jgi:hypothetical protein
VHFDRRPSLAFGLAVRRAGIGSRVGHHRRAQLFLAIPQRTRERENLFIIEIISDPISVLRAERQEIIKLGIRKAPTGFDTDYGLVDDELEQIDRRSLSRSSLGECPLEARLARLGSLSAIPRHDFRGGLADAQSHRGNN